MMCFRAVWALALFLVGFTQSPQAYSCESLFDGLSPGFAGTLAPLPERYQKMKIKRIIWPEFIRAPRCEPCATGAMKICSGVIVFLKSGEHYLAHVPIGVSYFDLIHHWKQHLPELSKTDQIERVEVISGFEADYTTEVILYALGRVNPELLSRVRFKKFPKGHAGENVVIVDGESYFIKKIPNDEYSGNEIGKDPNCRDRDWWEFAPWKYGSDR